MQQNNTNNSKLKALILICTLKPSPEQSSSDKLAHDLDGELSKNNIQSEFVRVVDHNIMPGVKIDMGEGDEWPMIREKMLNADIFIIATPTWMGQMSSLALRVIERLNAELSQADDQGRPLTFGKVAAAIVVGNEDGAHKISADLFQSLNDLGFSLPAQAATYWNGEAMQMVDYIDLDEVPEPVGQTNRVLARNLSHLARLLRTNKYPGNK